MNKDLLPVEKENIFTKIKKFFYRLFSKNEESVEETNLVNEREVLNTQSSDFDNKLKIEVDSNEVLNEVKKENFISELEDNPEVLENLSLDRLKKIEEYYENRVAEKREFLKKLQNNNA